jgi:hypothetical protein
LTGLPVCIAAMQEIGSTVTSTLPPKPPPTVPPTTCSLPNGTSRMSAVLSSVKNAACVSEWIFRRPSALGSTMQPVVSVGACSIGRDWYLYSKMWSAWAKPCSTSPKRTRRQ